jgi:ssDNA-binding Zn-finger/Zn-ribbon topoisomerase 1
MKNIFPVIWGIIVVIWLAVIFIGLSSNLSGAQSAMQASQLYNDATTTILAIIALTLVFYLGIMISNQPSGQLQEQLDKLNENTSRLTELLAKFEQHFGGSPFPNPEVPKQVVNNEIMAAIQNSTQSQAASVSAIKVQTNQQPEGFRYCPKCNSLMNIKTATKGENKGKQYYVCSKYPTCSEVIPV